MENNGFKRIDLNNPNTFETVQVNNKFIIDDFGEEIKILVNKKDEKNFYGAYRTKDLSGGNMINLNVYHLLPNGTIENYGAYSNFKEMNCDTRQYFQRYDAWMKEFGM